jgi:glycosyltransferase involved in cell wall biosynthesis
MKISIAIISHNAENHIRTCLDSCVNQTFKDLDIVIVDDNSTDSTVKIIKEYQLKDKRINLVVHDTNKSALQARKTAIRYAKHEYVWFIDSDDCIDDLGAVGIIHRSLKKNNKPDMICFGSSDYYENGELKRVFYDWGRDKPLNEWKIDSDFRPYTRVTKKSVLEQAVSVIPDDLYLYRHNDLFMFCLVKLCTKTRCFIDKPLYRYTLSSSSVTNQKDKESIAKHATLLDTLFSNYRNAAKNIAQTDVCVDEFIESERSKLVKYAKSQYCFDSDIYLHALKKFYRNETTVIISLTTYSKRIETVDKVITSLLEQTVSVDKIILWLDESETNFEQLPKQLRTLTSKRFEVKFCPNYKSYKKLIPTLKEYPEATLITFDDDIYYPKDQVEKLLLAHYESPNEIITNVARNILVKDGLLQPYSTWLHAFEEQVGKPLSSLLPIGVGGVLYPAGSLNEEVSNIEAFMRLAPHGDDLWFKCMTLWNNRKVIVTGDGFTLGKYQLEGTAEIGLWQSVNEGSDSNYEQLMAVALGYPQVQRILLGESFNKFLVSQSDLIEFYATLKEINKKVNASSKHNIKEALGNLKFEESQVTSGPAFLQREKTLGVERNIVKLNGNSDFITANRFFRERKYNEAASLYLRLMQANPDFKYYKVNYEKTMEFLEGKEVICQ